MPISPSSLSSSLGLPTRQDLLLQKGQADTVPAVIQSQDPKVPDSPAKLSEGEYVISVPAIIALGEGDYDKGLALLDKVHQELRQKGAEIIQQQGLGSVKGITQ